MGVRMCAYAHALPLLLMLLLFLLLFQLVYGRYKACVQLLSTTQANVVFTLHRNAFKMAEITS